MVLLEQFDRLSNHVATAACPGRRAAGFDAHHTIKSVGHEIFGAQFLGMEIRAYLSYKRKKHLFSYWRSTHGYEVDFLIGRQTAVEVKASQKITARDFKGLKALEEEKVFKNYILVSQDPINTRDNNYQALYWERFLENLWNDKLV